MNVRPLSGFRTNLVEFHYVPQPSPQQANVSDCGIHVLYNTRVLIQRLMFPIYRPERPWDLSDIQPDTQQNRAALRMLFQQRLIERSSTADRESSWVFPTLNVCYVRSVRINDNVDIFTLFLHMRPSIVLRDIEIHVHRSIIWRRSFVKRTRLNWIHIYCIPSLIHITTNSLCASNTTILYRLTYTTR